jgi:methylated-DNA-[protein]-cysteine S-methyltransferase
MTTNRIDAHVAWDVCETPLGPFLLEATGNGLSRINFPGRGGPHAWDRRDPVALDPAIAALEAYFAGERTTFGDLTLDLSPSPLEEAVWSALRDIPYGETVSYGELARTVGRPDIVRGVAAAVGRVPVPIVIPCHRVIGADGSLTGYGGGLQRKQALLDLERRVATGLPPEPAWAYRQLALI